MKRPGRSTGQVRLELSEPPEGIAIQKVSRFEGGVAIDLRTNGEKIKPGLKGNLIVNAFVERVPRTKDGKPRGPRRRIPMGTLPAIPFEVVD